MDYPKKGLILINAYSTMLSAKNQSIRMKEEFEKLGVECDIFTNDIFAAYIQDGDIKLNIQQYDFCLYLDKDKYISKMLEKKGIRLFNTSNSILLCDDKFDTFIALSDNHIPMPKTIPGLLCYSNNCTVKRETIEKIEKELGYPVIIKESYGSLGKGVYIAYNREELSGIAQKLIGLPHIFQQAVTSSIGKDLRVIVIGDKAVAAMKRTSQTDFRSNIELGGEGSVYELSEKQKNLCVRVSKLLGLDYCGIDLLFGENGEMLVCEVNSNAFFGGIERVTGINVARLYCNYIITTIYGDNKK